MDRLLREQGSRDRRLLPVALTMWMASLGAHHAYAWLAAAYSGHKVAGSAATYSAMWPSAFIPVGIVLAVLVILVGIAMLGMRKGGGPWFAMIAVCAAASSIAATSAIIADTLAWLDPIAIYARTASTVPVTAEISITTPILVSNQRDFDCQADVRLISVRMGKTVEPHDVGGIDTAEDAARRSFAAARLYALGEDCNVLERGARYRMKTTVRQAEYGSMPIWLLAEEHVAGDKDSMLRLRAPPMLTRMVTHMQQSFFRVTQTLSDQGRVLVPGLTIGVLGQDHYSMQSDMVPVDDTYANTVEDAFRRSGIMHLMAVSGGHFVLLAMLIRRVGLWLLADRRIIAGMLIVGYGALAAVVFPGDSVSRALIMGIMSAVGYAIGRRAQALSALCWTVIGSLVLMPGMSLSYGFALSCAAVLGIVLFTQPFLAALSRVMPHVIAQAMAMTMAAQLFTLPIQVLMEPELPLLSVPANLLVAPVVSIATIVGLLCLCCAWCAPDAANMLAWLASSCTRIMERVAYGIAGLDMASVPWAGGVLGAAMILMVECAGCMMLMCVSRCLRRRHTEPGLPGERFGRLEARRVRIALWWRASLHMLWR
ncbi:ComEC/Rec2 family competence protein [Bifidobacterium sp. LC6]|uniref:ComEC/Rec2 family competence protein n=1 Tax=Bifidobacterium colobi TaxID=2809026 RepID=A0ABS5UXR6_9BIFI|nr:ComEC/Rec2 family competence protein [Bifidobacterium colobi]MBT1175929.1 ComEC/Rec2 family competence protein [Bifidobacterium colobi]